MFTNTATRKNTDDVQCYGDYWVSHTFLRRTDNGVATSGKGFFFNFTAHVACDLAILLLSCKKRMCANDLYMGVNDIIHSSFKARHSSNVHQLTNKKANWVCAYNMAQR